MKSAQALALSLLPCLLGALAPAQEPTADQTAEEIELRAKVRDLESKLVVARAAGLESIRVNGKELTPQHVRREAIFLVGARLVDAKISDFFIDEWKETQIKEGRDPSEFTFSEELIVEQLKGQVEEFQQKYPGVEFWEAVRSMTGLTKEGYMQQRRQTELFRKVFFPGPPTEWPSITREAIMASAVGDSGQMFWENIEKSATDPETGKPKELPEFWIQLSQTWVLKQLKEWSEIRYPSDGLPADVVLSVNGREWNTDAAFEFVRPALFQQDIERAMTEMVIREALKQELQRQGAYLDDDQYRAAFDEYRKEFDGTPFNTEVIATAFKGYPSLEAFRQRWRLMRSYENMIAKEINDDNLQAHADRYSRFFSDGKTSLDVIQFLARSVKTGAWEPDGFPRAKERAQNVLEKINGGESFDAMLDQHAEFYVTEQEKGRLPNKSLNALRQSVRETEFTDLLMGYSVGAFLFYDAEPERVFGPLRGPEGYYLARVNARSPARGGVTIRDPRTRELVKQDYLTYRFQQWSNDVLAETKVE